MPAPIDESLRLQASAIVEANLRIAAESARLFTLFQSAGLQLLFLKGLTLGALAYRAPFLKMGWDIDLLVDHNRLPGGSAIASIRGLCPGHSRCRWQDTRNLAPLSQGIGVASLRGRLSY